MPARALLLPVVVASAVASLVAFTLGVLLTSTLLHTSLAQAEPTPQNGGTVVQAQRFEILDSGGVVRGYLGMQDDRHVLLRMGAADEQPHVSLGLINYLFSSLVVLRQHARVSTQPRAIQVMRRTGCGTGLGF